MFIAHRLTTALAGSVDHTGARSQKKTPYLVKLRVGSCFRVVPASDHNKNENWHQSQWGPVES